jgi:drug/metabolite transporter (DMT)-like permease
MNNLRASLMMVLAMAGFAIEDAMIKYLATRMPAGQVMILLGLGGVGIFWVLAARKGVRLWTPDALRGAALLRNLGEMIAAALMVTAITLVPLSVVTAILQAMPLLVTMGAALVLGERVGWRRWVAIGLGFVGMILILRPGAADFDPAALFAVGAVLALTLRDLATRRLPPGMPSVKVSGWGFATVLPGGALLLLVAGRAPVPVQGIDALGLVLTVVCAVAAYAALVQATRLGDIAATTPFRYTRLVFAMAIGVAVFGEWPDGLTLAGSALIVGAGLYTLWRETLRARMTR